MFYFLQLIFCIKLFYDICVHKFVNKLCLTIEHYEILIVFNISHIILIYFAKQKTYLYV